MLRRRRRTLRKSPRSSRRSRRAVSAILAVKGFCSPPSPRRKRIHLVENPNGFEYHAAHDLQALGAEFVGGILRRVPEDIVVAVHEVNQIGSRYAALHERNMVVPHLIGTTKKMRLVSKTLGRFANDIFEPRGRVRVAIDVEISIPDHVR